MKEYIEQIKSKFNAYVVNKDENLFSLRSHVGDVEVEFLIVDDGDHGVWMEVTTLKYGKFHDEYFINNLTPKSFDKYLDDVVGWIEKQCN